MKKKINYLLALALIALVVLMSVQPFGEGTPMQIIINAATFLVLAPAWAVGLAMNNPELSDWLRR